MTNNYDTDRLDWLDEMMQQVEAASPILVAGGLVDYLEEMSISERNAIKSQFVRLIKHLLKYRFQPTKATPSWKESVDDARLQLSFIADENRKRFKTIFADILKNPLIYNKAKREAEKETKLDSFPKENPFDWNELFDDDFYG